MPAAENVLADPGCAEPLCCERCERVRICLDGVRPAMRSFSKYPKRGASRPFYPRPCENAVKYPSSWERTPSVLLCRDLRIEVARIEIAAMAQTHHRSVGVFVNAHGAGEGSPNPSTVDQ
jgi:hypothetical protein